MTYIANISVTKKACHASLGKKPFLAKVEIDGDERTLVFAKRKKISDTRYGYMFDDLQPGDVLQFRHRGWTNKGWKTTQGFLVINADGSHSPLNREEVDTTLMAARLPAPESENALAIPRPVRMGYDCVRTTKADDAKPTDKPAAPVITINAAETRVHHETLGEGTVELDHPNNPWVVVRFDKSKKKKTRVAREFLEWI